MITSQTLPGGTGTPSGAGTSRRRELKIKLEVDTDPPPGFATETRFLLQPIPFSVKVYDPPSLFAGKMHAVLCRGWGTRVKGRDWYDLVWYLSKRPPVTPNLVLLQNALDQTEGQGAVDGSGWARSLLDRLESPDMSTLAADVQPFLERPADVRYLTTDHLRTLLQR